MPTMPESIDINVTGIELPHLDQYFGPWSVEPTRFQALLEHVSGVDLLSHVMAAGGRSRDGGAEYDVTDDGVAVIQINGTLTKYGSSFSSAGSMVELRRQVRLAARDKAITSIVLHIDSPGGSVSGLSDLVDEVSAAGKMKPVTAYIEDLGASAAYEIASQAQRVYANRSALVGSIGTYGVLYDMSGAAGMKGIRAIVVKAGEFKGSGAAGAPISDAQVAEYQRIVDSFNEDFIAAVARGRAMTADQVRALADGRIHIAAEAKKLGLIDGIKTFDQVLREAARSDGRAGARAESSNTPAASAAAEMITHEEVSKMPDTTAAAEPQAATYEQLRAGLIGADAAFLCSQLEAKATIEQATAAWMAEQQARTAKAVQAAEDARAATVKTGVAPLGTGQAQTTVKAEASIDPVAAWDERVAERIRAGQTRAAAIKAVATADPDLHRAYLEAYNAQHAPAQRRR